MNSSVCFPFKFLQESRKIGEKIEKYQKILDEFESANKEESPDLTWAGTSGYSV